MEEFGLPLPGKLFLVLLSVSSNGIKGIYKHRLYYLKMPIRYLEFLKILLTIFPFNDIQVAIKRLLSLL